MDHYCFQFFTVTLLLCKHVLLYLEVVKGEHERLFHLAGTGVGAAPTWVNVLLVLGSGAEI